MRDWPKEERAHVGRQTIAVDQVYFLVVGMSVAALILLATRIYFVEELLVFLIALAVLFALGVGVLLLVILFQEVVRWSGGQIVGTKQTSILIRADVSIPSPNAIHQHGN